MLTMGDSEKNQGPIRAALLTMPPDGPEYIANLVLMLHSRTDFQLTILGCKPKSFFSLGLRDPITGLSMRDFTAKQFIKYGRGKIQTHCRLVGECLGDRLSRDNRPKISHISGRPYTIANMLESMFDLFIIPRPLRVSDFGQHVFGDIGLQLVRAKKIPVLFSAGPEKWQRIIIMEVDGGRDYGELCVMNYLLKFLGEAVLKEKPKDIPTISLHSDTSTKQSPGLASYGILDASKISPEQQADTILVISTKIACSVLRYRRLKSILQIWSGGVLVFPP